MGLIHKRMLIQEILQNTRIHADYNILTASDGTRKLFLYTRLIQDGDSALDSQLHDQYNYVMRLVRLLRTTLCRVLHL